MKKVMLGLFMVAFFLATTVLAEGTQQRVFVGTDSVAYESNGESYDAIFFDTDKSNIKDIELEKIEMIAKDMKDNNVKVIVTGRADLRGSRLYNLDLSDRRANSVKAKLVELGVPTENIISVSLGEEKPVAPNDKLPEHLQANRRVEIIPVKPLIKETIKTTMRKNRVMLLGGVGPQGLNKADISPDTVSVTQHYNPAVGLGYSRLVTERFSVGVTIFSNISGFINVGFDF